MKTYDLMGKAYKRSMTALKRVTQAELVAPPFFMVPCQPVPPSVRTAVEMSASVPHGTLSCGGWLDEGHISSPQCPQFHVSYH